MLLVVRMNDHARRECDPMGFWNWLNKPKPTVRARKRKAPQRRRTDRKRDQPTAALAHVKKDVDSIRDHLANHDVQLAELKERTSDRCLEQLVRDVVNRLQPALPPIAVERSSSQPITVQKARQPLAIDSNTQLPASQQVGLRLTPTQRVILHSLADDGGDRYLSYADIGRLVYKSAGAVKYHINRMKQQGIALEWVVAQDNQARRYKISSQLKHLFGERR